MPFGNFVQVSFLVPLPAARLSVPPRSGLPAHEQFLRPPDLRIPRAPRPRRASSHPSRHRAPHEGSPHMSVGSADRRTYPPEEKRGGPSNHQPFNVVYDGPALGEHRMDVRDLAPVLLAIADLFSSANKELNGDHSEVRLEVRGGFKAGSFHAELIFVQPLASQIRDLFAGPNANAFSNALAILAALGIIGGGGLIGLIRTLRGRKPHRTEPDGAHVKIWMSEQECFVVDEPIVRLYRNRAVRVNLQKMLSPLEHDGIDSFGIVRDDIVELSIERDELGTFASSDDPGEIVTDTIALKMLKLESVVFKDGNKWRVHDGTSAFYTSLDDERFIAKVDAGERFGKGDVLVVDLRQTQIVTDEGLRNEYRIVKVREHRAPLQPALI
ncbi:MULTISPECIES: hypothetical protein [unclassified Burkholderia]|uniref:hypothetical protein n=1 Tax=unclassified Burkholderia TaxID=2613784 RepID=UPI0021AB1B89|nr:MULTISPECIES: hypothetical protein [unclassified Burkholderia]